MMAARHQTPATMRSGNLAEGRLPPMDTAMARQFADRNQRTISRLTLGSEHTGNVTDAGAKDTVIRLVRVLHQGCFHKQIQHDDHCPVRYEQSEPDLSMSHSYQTAGFIPFSLKKKVLPLTERVWRRQKCDSVESAWVVTKLLVQRWLQWSYRNFSLSPPSWLPGWRLSRCSIQWMECQYFGSYFIHVIIIKLIMRKRILPSKKNNVFLIKAVPVMGASYLTPKASCSSSSAYTPCPRSGNFA